ncbi:hypothetical protein AVEN_240181-1, partial [Araneus ventricosus]
MAVVTTLIGTEGRVLLVPPLPQEVHSVIGVEVIQPQNILYTHFRKRNLFPVEQFLIHVDVSPGGCQMPFERLT